LPNVQGSVREPTPHPLDFRTLFELEVGYVLRSLRRLGVAPADLEDMTHEVFLAVHDQLSVYDRSRPVRPWLFAFAFRIASHYRRKARRETNLEVVEDIPDVGEPLDILLDKKRKQELVLLALEDMDLDRRAVFVLHEIDGTTCEQIAGALEIPIGTVYSRLRLAREDFSAKIRRLHAKKVKR